MKKFIFRRNNPSLSAAKMHRAEKIGQNGSIKGKSGPNIDKGKNWACWRKTTSTRLGLSWSGCQTT